GGDTPDEALAVADDVLCHQAVFLAQIGAKFHGLLVYGGEVVRVRQIILANLERDVGIVAGAFGSRAAVPAAIIPRQHLIGGNRAVRQFADKGVGAHLPPVRLVLVPVVAVLVFPQQAIVRADIALEVGVVGPG